MNIVWIGAGNVATQFALACRDVGHTTLQVYSRTLQSAEMLADSLDCDATDDVAAVRSDADVYVFAVKDSALEDVIDNLSPRVSEGLCMHTSGSMSMDVFRGKVSRFGVCYPMQTFSKKRNVDFRCIPLFVEASDECVMNELRVFAESISCRVYELTTECRKILHLAAVFACNFVNHCYALSAELLAEASIDFDVMLPLIDETASKVHAMSPLSAQTGPAVRYDKNILDFQSKNLSGIKREIYELMSESIYRAASNKQFK